MTDTYNNRNLTAFFDERDDAQEAVERLNALGITEASIRITGGDEYATARDDDKGFWESIADFFFPDEDRATYAEGLRRGGYLVTVSNVSADLYDQAADILDDEGSVDLEERASSWRSEGWAGTSASTASASSYEGSEDTVGTDPSAADDEGVIPIVEEQFRVGKRDVNLGRVEDRVEVERRPVDRALSGSEHLFTDRTIEAEEHVEEAVVSKDARVTEEIALRRRTDERTETISDTVRRTQVEVEDERSENRPADKTRRGR